jgi:membrane protein DedA with SNARE-associated domain
MSAEYLIQTYGYFALLLGALIEGETVLVIAGFAAHRGYLALPLVILIAAAATILIDQFLYFMGRIYGRDFLRKRPALQKRSARFQELLQRYQTPVIIGFRFMYGMRIVAPFVIGMSGIARKRFMALNIASGLVWSAVFSCGGYCFGAALELVLGGIRQYELQAILIIALLGALFWMGRFYWTRVKRKDST